MRTYLPAYIGVFLMMSTPLSADYPIAGVEPSIRPENAPAIEWVNHNKAWYESSLTGIQQPYPKSLYFLDNQGDWYTPFNRPGMTGRYDLRKWHQ
ncbi:MAG: hypothetical protein KZQ93_13150 [Candidatus Thiodiazotropha sp. (ex Monitilora ramsayi)]|nr:hypothetical protein [Candidatus Thiodiazotropha sp. (ex Monitilora ramsayi)]